MARDTKTQTAKPDTAVNDADGFILPLEARNGLKMENENRLHQIEALTRFMPLYASTSIIGAFIISWCIYAAMPPILLFAWLGVLIAANLRSSRWVSQLAIGLDTDVATKGLAIKLIADNIGRALLWISAPAYTIAALNNIDQITLMLVGAVMICAALSLAAMPIIGNSWIVIITLGLIGGLLRGPIDLPTTILCLFALVPCFASAGVAILGQVLQSNVNQLAIASEKGTAAHNLLREYEERGGSWLWQTNANNEITFASSQLGQLLNRSSKSLIGQTLPGVFRGHATLADRLAARRDFMGVELQLHTQNGIRWFAMSGSAIWDKSPSFKGFRGVGVDITDSKIAQHKLQHLANLDTLTALPNRQRVRELLGEALQHSAATSTPCALVFLDLDGFKPVNDTYGHARGDVVLRIVAERLRVQAGQQGTVGRIGGDEFAIVVQDARSPKSIEQLAARVIAAISEPYVIDDLNIRIGISAGAAYGPLDADNVDELIRKADFALYSAKAQGRGNYRAFEPNMQVAAEDRISLENEMRAAIGTNQFYIAYQPQVNSETHVVTGFEALLRWQHPTRGFISPVTFIPIAEESGMIVQLGEWVLKTACIDAAQWPGHITVAVNVSPVQLLHPGLPNAVAEALRRSRLPANRLELEVTESIFLGDSDYSIGVLKRLRDIGLSIALDDFGTGYSSLGYLNKAVFHKLKIDGSFVRESATNGESTAIIKAMVSLAEAFRMSVTAECVETKEDLLRMRSLGCHQIQGFLFGRPMTQDKALELLTGARGSFKDRAA
ncbi:putative bifunctional diguanylate cyclase/phosphodiesterase [Aquisediminimonas sediminicola]|uniref:putative bifunctional diguanylate cyclase/phosphodiesterase n=1 Tax=Alteraquisediminimonas sediminicola TaxID=2676787 RepID=UPI001C8DA80B|nr:EAL domain-containing protein [Aquisediminimonas sediminicola]